MPIHKLDIRISEQIAAGEIVENPASVVKELVENSLDAGAKRIKVIFKRGGLQEITVIDDGSGIPAGEVRLALERHATSKISSLQDLQAICTLGFRGEALPSIASVSRMSISTRHRNEETGRYIFLEGGVEKETKEIGFPPGTRITVKDLFYNTPARLKFLKGVASEAGKISRIIHLLALSRPDTAFSLIKQNEVILELPGDGKLLNVITKIFGNDLARELVPLHFESAEFILKGYVSNPAYSRNSRNYQLFYINGRYIRSQLIQKALDRSFAGIVTSKRYPVAFLFLDIAPENLDVNVHPSKIEVRFHQEERVRLFLEQSLKEAFTPAYFLPIVYKQNIRDKDTSPEITAKQDIKEDFHPEDTIKTVKDNSYHDYTRRNLQLQVAESRIPFSEKNIINSALSAEPFTERCFDGLIKGQLFSTYIAVQKEDKLIFIDQHAAHERVIWEKLQQRKQKEEKEQYIQEILPLAVELPLQIADTVKDKLALLRELGLEMEQFGNNTVIIRAVPFFLRDIITAELILDILEEVSDPDLTGGEFQKEILLSLSCKAAIKANEHLTIEEISSLLAQLEKCKNPFFCPHGRPVAIKIEKYDIEKHFKRRG
ncbi:MAG TPA: DNA mismatch repair endonuclease MutL [Firmicutes bacterium]|jgi:DNA mismatch repair protein MutL|nr:DNA mismatch repair endonuclease MutL [Bacillota bacterium]